MPNIKNIIFDLGGVLLDIDYQRPVAAFADLGYTGFEHLYSKAEAKPLFEQLETGHISNDDFLKTMAGVIEQPVTNQQIIEAWNSILLMFRPASLAYLDALRPHYKLYLLSNTNAIHHKQIQHLYRPQTGRHSLDDCFEKAWYSHQIGLRKPGKEVYDFVLGDGGLLASETLFIDDSAQNIDAAKSLGIATHLLLPHQLIENLSLI